MKIPINVVVFDTAKGHFGRRDIFQKCIQDLNCKIPLKEFTSLYCHIKVGEGEQEDGEYMKAWYNNLGFHVRITEGQFSHFSESHQREYCKDMVTVFGDQYWLKAPYTLWLESDWKWDDKGGDLVKIFNRAIQLLEFDENVVSVRFPRFLNEVDRLNNLKNRHNMDVQCVPHQYFSDIYIHNDNFSCNPSVCRQRDLYLGSLVLKRNFEQFGNHAEMGWTHCLRWMSDSKYPYAVFDPKEISVLHCGTPSIELEDQKGKVFEELA